MRAAVAALFLSACAAGAPEAVRQGVAFVPDARGLGVAGHSQRIDFGRSPEGVIAALDRERGAGRVLAVSGCPAGVQRQVAWDDLVLTFTEERFVGWRRGDAAAGQVCV
jgi:hypothetical protein